MGIFLEKFQQENQDAIHIIQLDNAPIHTAKKRVEDAWVSQAYPTTCSLD